MKVAHHGSADPGLPELLRRQRPQGRRRRVAVGVLSNGDRGHARALRAAGVASYRNDRDGTVRLSIEDSRLSASPER